MIEKLREQLGELLAYINNTFGVSLSLSLGVYACLCEYNLLNKQIQVDHEILPLGISRPRYRRGHD